MRNENVTTIVANTYNIPLNLMMQAADTQGYQPEWLQFAQYSLDDPTNVRALPANQRTHMFGFSSAELPRPRFDGDCHVAYRLADPSSAADNSTCTVLWDTILQIANAIQVAGPNLTPTSIRDGLFKVGRRFPAERWAVGGGFGPGDFSYVDDFALMWWDPTATWAFDGSAGAYRFTHGGRRFRLGQVPTDVPFFEDGVTTAA